MGARSKKSLLSSLVDRAVAAVDVIDFSGQLRAERVYQALLLAAAAAGFAHGFATQSFAATFYWWLAASLLAGLLTVPGWPALYRRDAVAWLERLPTAEEDAAADAAEEVEAEKEVAEARRAAGAGTEGEKTSQQAARRGAAAGSER
jgi:hypothetical protein